MNPEAAARSEGLPRARRVRRRVEFLQAQRRGRRAHVAHYTVIFFDRGDSLPPRLGLVTSRRVGNAVRRNRIRRMLRELFRHEIARFPSGHDVVVIAKEGAWALDAAKIRDEILAAIAKRRANTGSVSRRPIGGAPT